MKLNVLSILIVRGTSSASHALSLGVSGSVWHGAVIPQNSLGNVLGDGGSGRTATSDAGGEAVGLADYLGERERGRSEEQSDSGETHVW
jgi:hypothetical protein